MTTQYEQKWKKYFREEDVKTVLRSNRKPVIVYDMAGKNQTDVLKDGTPVTVLATKKYDPRLPIKYKRAGLTKQGRISDVWIATPNVSAKGPKVNIVTTDLITSGDHETIMFAGQEVRVRAFRDRKTLIDSIMAGLRKRKVSPAILEIFDRYFKDIDKIEWTDNIKPIERRKLGIYVGELLAGVLILSKRFNQFHPSPFKSPIDAFLVPDDSRFEGIDSIIRFKSGELLPISNKLGKGGAASIFANLVPQGMELRDKLKPSVFRDLIDICIKNGIEKPAKQSKEVVYAYGVKKILGIDKQTGLNKIKEIMAVYHAIRKKDVTDEAAQLLRMIAESDYAEPMIKKALPTSITAFFTRSIAERLNNDKESVSQIKSILAGKNFWQANLHQPSWLRGDVKFAMINSGDVELKIIGNKSPVSQIEARQGTVNYELKFKKT